MSPLDQVDDKRCWICLATADDAPPPGLAEHDWRRPCKCNLVAHQSCLLEWAVEFAANHHRAPNNVPRCPQCQEPIRITKDRSIIVAVRETIESVHFSSSQVFVLSTIGGSLASVVYTTLYALGAASIRCMCPQDMALSALGVTVTQAGLLLEPMSLRRMLLVPTIPLALLLSTSRSHLVDVVTLALPLALADKRHPPWKFTGARLTIALLPVARIGYRLAYDSIVEPIIQSCARHVRPSYAGLPDTDQWRFNIQIDVDRDEAGNLVQARGPGRAGPAPPVNIFGRIVDALIHRLLPLPRRAMLDDQDADAPNVAIDGPAAEQAAEEAAQEAALPEVVAIVAADDADDADPADDPAAELLARFFRDQQPPQPGTADWVISRRSTLLSLGNALLLPLLSGTAGSLLSLVPAIRRWIPNAFNRNVAGGVLVLVLRDLINVATAFLRVRQETSRRVANFWD